MRRLILAVAAGFLLWSVLWLVAWQVAVTVYPEALSEDRQTVTSSGIQALFIFVSVMISVVAGWLAALLGRDTGKKAALILAGVLLIVGLGMEIWTWSAMAVWYHLIFLALLVPATLGGAAIKR